MKNVGNSSRWRSQGVPKIQGIHIAYRAHRAVIFVTAQLSCCISVYIYFVNFSACVNLCIKKNIIMLPTEFMVPDVTC